MSIKYMIPNYLRCDNKTLPPRLRTASEVSGRIYTAKVVKKRRKMK